MALHRGGGGRSRSTYVLALGAVVLVLMYMIPKVSTPTVQNQRLAVDIPTEPAFRRQAALPVQPAAEPVCPPCAPCAQSPTCPTCGTCLPCDACPVCPATEPCPLACPAPAPAPAPVPAAAPAVVAPPPAASAAAVQSTGDTRPYLKVPPAAGTPFPEYQAGVQSVELLAKLTPGGTGEQHQIVVRNAVFLNGVLQVSNSVTGDDEAIRTLTGRGAYKMSVARSSTLSTTQCRLTLDGPVFYYEPNLGSAFNIYHAHNDNLWPFFHMLTTSGYGDEEPGRPPIYSIIGMNQGSTGGKYLDWAMSTISKKVWSLSTMKLAGAVCAPYARLGRPPRTFRTLPFNALDYLVHDTPHRLAKFMMAQPVMQAVKWPPHAPQGKWPPTVTFVQRTGNRNRRLLKPEQLYDQFKKAGIKVNEVIFTDKQSFPQQLAIVAKSDVYMGVHGAGLGWATYLPRGALLVELCPAALPEWERSLYRRLANIKSLNYLGWSESWRGRGSDLSWRNDVQQSTDTLAMVLVIDTLTEYANAHPELFPAVMAAVEAVRRERGTA